MGSIKKYQTCYRKSLGLMFTHDKMTMNDFIQKLSPQGYSKEDILYTVNELLDKGLLRYKGDEFVVADWLCDNENII